VIETVQPKMGLGLAHHEKDRQSEHAVK
jgi:hypothetical protein